MARRDPYFRMTNGVPDRGQWGRVLRKRGKEEGGGDGGGGVHWQLHGKVCLDAKALKTHETVSYLGYKTDQLLAQCGVCSDVCSWPVGSSVQF